MSFILFMYVVDGVELKTKYVLIGNVRYVLF
jgi:hypothetical protein